MADTFGRIREIIGRTSAAPTIVNENSKFVIVTYWWGRGRLNYNTARPCTQFIEILVSQAIKMYSRSSVEPDVVNNPAITPAKHWNLAVKMVTGEYKKMLKGYTKEFKKNATKTTQMTTDEIESALKEKLNAAFRVCETAFTENIDIVKQLHSVVFRNYELRRQYKTLQDAAIADDTLLEPIRSEQRVLITQYNEINAALKNSLRPHILRVREILMYKPAMTFEEMIADWQRRCELNGCNHLAVEYPEFAAEGGYQLAINAKPLFIKKALESCGTRAVLYIDGDMTVNSYPKLFDMEDVDYMARGWGYDPRSSSHYQEQITVDPYTFETSGGIMYFSQSFEARRLADLWISESERPAQSGKSYDRIMSLIFNSQRLLAPMKMIQIPIEYLWLTMAYEEWVEDWTYETIIIEHPHCLTSEDTASAGGASESRQPVFYEGIGEAYPRSEDFYTSLAFPTIEMQETIRPWIDYMHTARYNEREDTIEAGLYDPATGRGKKAFNVYEFGSYGPHDETFRANMAALETTPDIATDEEKGDALVLMRNDRFTILNILKQLQLGRDIFFVPDEMDNEQKLSGIENYLMNEKENRIEMIFSDFEKSLSQVNIFYYKIDLTAPLYIRNRTYVTQSDGVTSQVVNPVLFKAIAMFKDINEMSDMFYKQYQILSRVRIHVFNPTPTSKRVQSRAELESAMGRLLSAANRRAAAPRNGTAAPVRAGAGAVVGGGVNGNNNFTTGTEEVGTAIAYNSMYGAAPTQGGSRRRYTRRGRRGHRNARKVSRKGKN